MALLVAGPSATPVLPCLLYEDEDLLVANKPAGLNTHAPSPYAGEGLYDWLRQREPRWSALAIIHRLDKETSGVIVFAKTPAANRSLTSQFTRRTIRKKYLLLTDRPVPGEELAARSAVARAGEKYVSRPGSGSGADAETRFRLLDSAHASPSPGLPGGDRCSLVAAEPLTGRTHQIRVHAAEQGFPILGDTLYGGTPAPRVYLHAAELTLEHPANGQAMRFCAPATFDPAGDARFALRAALLEPEATNAWRLLHGAADGWPGWYVDWLGGCLLSQSEHPLAAAQSAELARLGARLGAREAWHKILTRHVRRTVPAAASPQRLSDASVHCPPARYASGLAPEADVESDRPAGRATPNVDGPAAEPFIVRENGLQFELSFNEGYSVGLFLDQRDNRRRLLTGHVGAGFSLNSAIGNPPQIVRVLNTFAYTCAFSVCAAKAGAQTTSLDLSPKYLAWGRRNFRLNQLDPAGHEFIYGDAFDWLRRLARKARRFDVVLLDPPTFSQSKQSGVFRAEADYGRLVSAALPLLAPGGVLFASTNAADWPAEKFLETVAGAVQAAGRAVRQRHYAPQPPDFPITRSEPAYLKTVWLRIE